MPSIREQLQQRSTAGQDSRAAPSRLEDARRGVDELFSGRSTVGAQRIPDSPKEPNQQLGLHNMPSTTRIQIPYLSRPNSEVNTPLTSSRPARSARSIRNTFAPMRGRSTNGQGLRQESEQARIPAPPLVHRNSSGARRFVGVDPTELHLAELAHAGRRRRKQRSKGSARKCAPKFKNKSIRGKILKCFLSGLFLSLILTIYLALALSNRNESEEFHVLLILIILITTIFFCHSLIRVCMLVLSPPAEDSLRPLPSMIGPGGYAEPVVPIRVNLARDEEAAGIENEATKLPPPAYGLWRESVRMDPNRIYWQRNNAPLMPDLERSLPDVREDRPSTANRPPSYMSDDGIDYVIEATPRSTAPTVDVPLPPHPSERSAWPRV